MFDILFSATGLVVLSPLFLIIAIKIHSESSGPVFFRQSRVGRFGKDFIMYKFRTMAPGSDKKGLLTIGERDSRVTKTGYWLRKYKLDELPQLINVFLGDMSLVGPRPEVRKYVDMYNEEQKSVLNVRPGITDVASVKFRNENKILSNSENPEQFYISNIMPEKIQMNLEYIRNRSITKDFKVILNTITSIVK